MPAFPPNKRSWGVETEKDCADWFNAEVTNVILAEWTDYPAVLQVSHAKANRKIDCWLIPLVNGDKGVAFRYTSTPSTVSSHRVSEGAKAIGALRS